MTNLSSLSKAKFLALITLSLLSIVTVMDFLGLGHWFSFSVVLVAMAFLGGVVYLIRHVEKEIDRMEVICKALALGDLETRLTGIREKGKFGDFQWALNEMTDAVDAYVRETTAVMEHVSRNQYFRRILEAGMHGSYLNGARIINKATENVEAKMNGFIDVANDFDMSLGEVVKQINETVSGLKGTASEMQTSVHTSREGAQSAVQTSDNTSANVQTISAAAEEMSSCIAEITQQMSNTSRMAKNAVEQSDKTKIIIGELSSMAEKISNVVGIIDDIASQTSLLALNATIESARAGEAGKGFAVVANEVKALAGETTKATEEIAALVTEIQGSTDEVVNAFSAIGEVIQGVDQAATTVAAAIEEQSAASKEIATSAEQASQGTVGVAGNVKNIHESMTKVDSATQQVMVVTEELSGQTVPQVQGLLDKMGVFMDELKKIA